jgi:uncharacterized OB-fold protein
MRDKKLHKTEKTPLKEEKKVEAVTCLSCGAEYDSQRETCPACGVLKP